MSANLLDGATVIRGTKDADGYWVLSQNDGTDKKDSPIWRIDGQPTLTENQTVHVACSVMPDEDWTSSACFMSVGYEDAAGNPNWVQHNLGAAKAGVWTRLEKEVIVPSGMRIIRALVSNAYSNAAGAKVTGVTISYGSPVCLASSAHTPYATQDHVSVTYATKASLKVTDDSIKAEVSARAQTDQTVSDLSSRLTQTASGLSASISKLSETDQKVNAWFDFEADSSGNPQLKMGSSTSPVVGTYTNSGLAYKSRDGATIMELDASRSATVADHMEAQDVKIGKWKWVQTQGGTHLTLVWAG